MARKIRPASSITITENQRNWLTWLGVGLASLAGGLWAVFVYFDHRAADSATSAPKSNSGIYVGRDVSNSDLRNSETSKK